MNEKARPSCRFSTAKEHESRKTKTPTVGPEFSKTRMNCEKDEDDSETASLEPNP